MEENTLPRESRASLLSTDFVLIIIAGLGTSFVNNFFFSSLSLYADKLTGTVAYAGYLSLAYSVTALVIRPVSGLISDKYGRVKLIVVGAALCTVSCLMYNMTTGLILLLMIRVFNGIGMSLNSTSAGAAIPDIVPREKLAQGIGIFGLGSTLAQAIGPFIALSIVGDGSMSNFRTLFFVAAAFCAVSLIGSCFIRYEHKAREAEKERLAEEVKLAEAQALSERLDLSEVSDLPVISAASDDSDIKKPTRDELVARGESALGREVVRAEVVTRSEEVTHGEHSRGELVTHSEPARSESEVPESKTIFGLERQILSLFIMLLVYFVGISAVLSYLTLFAEKQGFALEHLGWYYFVNAGGVMISRLFFGKLVDKRGGDIVIIPSLIVIASCLALIPLAPSLPLLICIALPYGLASGASGPAMNAAMFKRCSPKRRGAVSAAYFVAIDIGISLGTPIMGLIADAVDFRYVYWLSAAIVGAAILIYIFFASDKRYARKYSKSNIASYE